MSLTFPWWSDHPLLEICGHPFKQMPASSWNTNVHVAAVLGSYEKLNFSIFLQGLSIRKDGFELPCVSVIHRLPLQSLDDLGLVEVLGPLLLTTASATKRQNKLNGTAERRPERSNWEDENICVGFSVLRDPKDLETGPTITFPFVMPKYLNWLFSSDFQAAFYSELNWWNSTCESHGISGVPHGDFSWILVTWVTCVHMLWCMLHKT